MSSIFLYDPLYDFERILGDAISERQSPSGDQQQLHRHRRRGTHLFRNIKPRMDLHEDAEKNIVTATFEFPGVPKEGINIEVHNGRLTVSAETKESTERNEHGYEIRERTYGKYSRTLRLPQDVTEDEINAKMENGVLTVTFPKTTPELARRRIAIH